MISDTLNKKPTASNPFPKSQWGKAIFCADPDNKEQGTFKAKELALIVTSVSIS